jgi:hypothetical protein
MAEPFVLTAVPQILLEGPTKGHLKYVQFSASDGLTSHHWWSTNTGTYVEDFAKIMPKAEAYAIVASLRRGETVILPGYWALDEIKHKFGSALNE